LEVRLLGPIEVLIDGRPVALGARTERALVACLAWHANQPVSTDAIVDALWGEHPPLSAREMVRTYVARARRRLGDALQHCPAGYVLEVAPDAIDAVCFERLCARGMEQHAKGDLAAAADSLTRALALWGQAPAPELDSLASARHEIARLEALRLTAMETHAEAELSLGDAARLVSDLEGLVRAHPYRERLRRALMLALYRCGRQAEALECYLDGRRLLVEGLGIEPTRELQALQQAILNQDPTLDISAAAAATAPTTGEPAAAEPPGPKALEPELAARRGRRLAGGVAALATLAVALLIARELTAGTAAGSLHIGRETLALIDPTSGATLRTQAVTGVPGPIAVGTRAAWVGDGQNRSVLTVSPDSLKTIGIARLGVFPYQLATDGTTAWAGDGFYGTITPIDHTGRESSTFRPESRATGRLALAYGAGALWVGSQDGTHTEIDPRTERVIAVLRHTGDPEALAVGAGSVWVAEAGQDDVRQVDPVTHRVTRSIPIGGTPSDIAIGDGSVWAITPSESRVWRIDPRTNAVTAAIDVAPQSSLITVIDNKVWVGSATGTLQRLDPNQNAVAQTLQLDGPVGGIAPGNHRLWISVR
jgi:DNA-binding SARP family transcriptional activator/glutamine cyclotransferase